MESNCNSNWNRRRDRSTTSRRNFEREITKSRENYVRISNKSKL